MAFLKVKAIVIAGKNFNDADKIVTLLTPLNGLIEASAKGARKPRSPLASCTQQFTYGEFDLFVSSDGHFYSINGCQIIDSFRNLTSTPERFAIATYITKTISKIIQPEQNATDVLLLLACALFALNKSENQKLNLIKRIFEFRLLCMEGFTPQLDRCVCCNELVNFELTQEENKNNKYFFPTVAGICCDKCTVDELHKPILSGTYKLMQFIAASDIRKIFSVSVTNEIFEQLDEIVPMLFKENLSIDVTNIDFMDLFT